MKNVVWIAVAICTFTALAFAADRPSDVKGWTATTWGMTEGEILKALPAQASQLAKPVKYADRAATVGIERLTINHTDFIVDFLPDQQGRLDRVLLRPVSENPLESVFQTLAASLTEKYGPADFKDPTSGPVQKRIMRWTFPSTTIELLFTNMSIIKRNNLVLVYDRSTKKDLDKM